MANPKTFTKQSIVASSDEDIIQIKDSKGNVISWIDSSGITYGNMAANPPITGDYISLPSPDRIGNASTTTRAGGPIGTVAPPYFLQALKVRIDKDILVSKVNANIGGAAPNTNGYFGLYDSDGNLVLELKVPTDAVAGVPIVFSPTLLKAGLYIWANGTDEDYASQAATITNISLTSNVVTITCNNTFQSGQVLFLSGITNATFLNGQKLTVLASNLSPTQFTANFTHANYTSAADTGTAIITDAAVRMTGYSFDNFYLNVFGFRVNESISAGHLPATITDAFIPNVLNVSMTKCINNVITVYADDQRSPLSPTAFAPGQKVTLGQMSTQTFLNGVELTISSSDYRSFTAPFVHSDYNLTVETGFPPLAPSSMKAQITNVQVSSGIATITCSGGHGFSIGERVAHTGMTTVTGLNGHPWPILSTGFSPTTYQVRLFQADVALSPETGIALPSFSGNNNYIYSSPTVILQ